jgi:hypothetical protein
MKQVMEENGQKIFRSKETSLDQCDLQFLVRNGIVTVVATKYEDRFVPRSRYNRYRDNEETMLQDLENNQLYSDLESAPVGRHFKTIRTDKKLVKGCSYNIYQLTKTSLYSIYEQEKIDLERKWANFL